MYKPHPDIIAPKNPNIRIWRYIDFPKFLWMLEQSSIFFSRADKFEDPYEGKYGPNNIRKTSEMLSQYVPSGLAEAGAKEKQRLQALFTMNQYVCCWHINEGESAAMWDLYSSRNQGVAIQSTFKRLCDAFNHEKRDILIGEVTYRSYDDELIPEGNAYHALLSKRLSFSHERELRAIVADVGHDVTKPNFDAGLDIEIGLNRLIDNLFISPLSPKWIVDLVYKLKDRYNIDADVIKSSLYDRLE